MYVCACLCVNILPYDCFVVYCDPTDSTKINTILGNVQTEFDGMASPTLSVIICILFVVVASLLMLNLLIALMNDGYTKIRDRYMAQWRLEQAKLIIEEACLLPKSPEDCFGNPTFTPKYIHLLQRTAEVETKEESVDSNQQLLERITVLEEHITKITGMLSSSSMFSNYLKENDEDFNAELPDDDGNDEEGMEADVVGINNTAAVGTHISGKGFRVGFERENSGNVSFGGGGESK